MDFMRTVRPRCFFVAWIFSWVTAIYLPSVLIAIAGLSPLVTGKGLPAGTFAVADEVAPAAKLSFALLVALFMFVARRIAPARRSLAVAADMLLALSAMLLVLAILPEDWSRGFGIGLTGTRFAPALTTIYASGGLLSGLVFSMSEAKCSTRRSSAVQ